jgi:hypothetical protein
MIFKEYSFFIYHTTVLKLLDTNTTDNDIINIIIYFVKTEYDKDRSVIKPYITSITDNNNEILDKFNFIKTSYVFKIEAIEKFEKLKEAIEYLEYAKKYDEKSKNYNKKAIDILYKITSSFENSLNKLNNYKNIGEKLFIE